MRLRGEGAGLARLVAGDSAHICAAQLDVVRICVANVGGSCRAGFDKPADQTSATVIERPRLTPGRRLKPLSR